MKRHIAFMAAFLMVAGMAAAGKVMALSPPPELKVSLSSTDSSTTYRANVDPVNLKLILEYTGTSGDFITSEGFFDQRFMLMLHFTYNEGRTGEFTARANNLEQIIYKGGIDAPIALHINGVQAEAVTHILTGDWWEGTIEATGQYPLSRAGEILVRARIPGVSYSTTFMHGGREYAALCLDDSSADCWHGVFVSAPLPICITDDADGDGSYAPCAYGATGVDCDDGNASVHPGAVEVPGNGIDDDCDTQTADPVETPKVPVTVQADKHTVGTGNTPSSSKEPLQGLPVKVYSKASGSCASEVISKLSLPGFSWQSYKSIWWSSCVPEASGTTCCSGSATGAPGQLEVSVEEGDYLVLAEYDPDGNKRSGDEVYLGKGTTATATGEIRYLQVIEKPDSKKVPAKYTVKTGSQLLIIEPEYIEWSSTQEFYPFVFDSVGDWTVTTTVTPPEGFVADQPSLTAEVNTDLKALQFIITDVGSKWVETGVTYDLQHKGKKEKITSKIGIKCSKELAKKKGFDAFCKKPIK